ncbi:MAG: histidine kinase dimerization/phospho-acceptor domain-containing protein, partial [Opitutaceae bacterium]
MGTPTAKRRLVAYVILIGLGLAVCGWQAQEHLRFKRNAAEALINRGTAITETLRVVVRSQQGYGPFVTKDRLEPALDEFVRTGEVEAIAFLSASGETVARAREGKTIQVSAPEIANSRGVLWSEQTLTLMNLTNWDSPFAEEGVRPGAGGAPIILDRPQGNRTPPQATGATPGGEPPAATNPPPTGRRRFGQTLSREEIDNFVKNQGVKSIVISLSTSQMRRAVNADLLLRLLVSALAMGGAIISTLAWRNFGKSAELQIRLIKAGEMNTHLKEMNLAAAGLAHETRNPLNLIRGRAQMIAMQAESSPKLKENASIIIEEADRVTVQLNEFINYSKPREAQLAPIDVQRLVADVSRTLLPDIEEKQIEMTQPAAPVSVEADEQLLRQALFNVLLNAVQAVPPGGKIAVKISAAGVRGGVLEICDDGP